MDPDFAVVGGGIAGCAAAAFLAEAGAAVALFEREDVGAAASGRNSGAVQHPFDPELTPLHWETLELYRRLASECDGFSFPDEPAGLLLLSPDGAQLGETAAALRQAVPELEARILDEAELRAVEPAASPGLLACRLDTAYVVPPASATHAFAELARRHGARVEVGIEAEVWLEHGRARGVAVGGERLETGAVLVAAGPWSVDLIAGAPIRPVWGLNVELWLPDAPAHVLEQAGVEVADPSASAEAAAPAEIPSLFSLVTVGAASTLGSTFLDEEPDAGFADELKRRGARFVPALEEAEILSTRACARPQSADGRPLVGPVPGVERLFTCTGHGPWGISIGPASARLVADAMLGRAVDVPPALRPDRFRSFIGALGPLWGT